MKNAAALCAGLAAWCSFGALGFVEAGSADPRVALLPAWWLLPIFVLVVRAAMALARLAPNQVSPLFGSAVLLLPWLPVPVPPAALLWTGPFMLAVWVAVVAGMVSACWPSLPGPWLTDPRRAPIVAAAIALALYGASAWWLAPILPNGDSPHYLILAQSLVKDGDIQIENNHRRGDYLDYSLEAAQPDYLRRGVNGAIYSIHAPGLPAVIAPAMWLFGYPGAVAWLGVVAALGTALVWRLSYLVTASASAAWLGWACCALTAPFLFQATEVFPDGLAATCLLVGTIPLALGEHGTLWRREPPRTGAAPWLVSGAALAVLPWLQTRLAILAVASALCVCLRIRSARQLAAFAILPAASAIAWFGFFDVVYGTFDPRAPYGPYTQSAVANLRRGFPALFFDEQFGLVANAPVYGLVFAGILAGAARMRRWSWEVLAIVVPYAVAVGMYQMWWGGASAPARLLAPIALVLGVGGARVWQDARTRATRAVYAIALAMSAVIAAVLLVGDHGQLLFNVRDGVARWLEWGHDLLDLPRGLPSAFTEDPARALAKAGIWAACALAGWLVLRRFEGGPRGSRGARAAALPWALAIWCLAVATMTAFTLVWRTGGVEPLTPASAELGLLRYASALRPLAYDFGARRFSSSRDVLARARVRSDDRRTPAGPAPLLSAVRVPAGTYELHVTSRAGAEGGLAIRIGDTPLPLWTSPAASAEQHSIEAPIRLPLDVRSLIVEGDAAAVRSIASVDLEPVGRAESPGLAAAGGAAHRGVRYAAGDAFFLDENAYPEPAGFWVAGGRTARTVIATPGPGLELFLRNAPVGNSVTVEIDGERHEVALGPGDERAVMLPRARPAPYATVRISSRGGFRPSQGEPGNQDLRYLGCWVEIR